MLNLNHKSKPSTTNDLQIFNLDARIKSALVVFALLCQCISFSTEWLGMKPFLFDLLSIVTPTHAAIASNVAAFTISLFIEFLIFFLVAFIISSLKAKYWTLGTNNIDKIFNRIKFGTSIVLLGGLLYISMTLSKKNVAYQLESLDISAVSSTSKFDNRLDHKEELVRSEYKTDKADLDKSFKDTKQSINSSFDLQNKALTEDIKQIEGKESRTGKSYRTQKQKLQERINKQEQKRADQLRQLTNRYNDDLAGLKADRKSSLLTYNTNIRADKQTAEAKSAKLTAAITKRNNWLSYFLTMLATWSVVGAVIARAWICMSLSTSNVEEKTLVKPEYFSSGLFVELITLIILVPSRFLQNIVRARLEKVPNLIELKEQGAILKLKPIEEPKNTTTSTQVTPKKNVAKELTKKPISLNTDKQDTRVVVKGFSTKDANVVKDVKTTQNKAHDLTNK